MTWLIDPFGMADQADPDANAPNDRTGPQNLLATCLITPPTESKSEMLAYQMHTFNHSKELTGFHINMCCFIYGVASHFVLYLIPI